LRMCIISIVRGSGVRSPTAVFSEPMPSRFGSLETLVERRVLQTFARRNIGLTNEWLSGHSHFFTSRTDTCDATPESTRQENPLNSANGYSRASLPFKVRPCGKGQQDNRDDPEGGAAHSGFLRHGPHFKPDGTSAGRFCLMYLRLSNFFPVLAPDM